MPFLLQYPGPYYQKHTVDGQDVLHSVLIVDSDHIVEGVLVSQDLYFFQQDSHAFRFSGVRIVMNDMLYLIAKSSTVFSISCIACLQGV